jgi:lipopolysaccharide transport system ATP-binding protein
MGDVAIKVEGLGKRYRIGAKQQAYKTLREELNQSALAPFRAIKSLVGRNGHNSQSPIRNSKSDAIWALNDVSFEVRRAEVIGVIGRNGAGKSTLLKILSRITEPTEGYADINGRIASLLEVGTGFHSELTGRENIFLNGSILGMKRAEIKKKFDEMVAFAEIEKFIDTPVKHYSSGMYVRLAFAVAAHLDPEIMFVDEVLAVGDAAFQKKCLGKMGDVAKEGRTLLFVSHNMDAVATLCAKSMLIHEGRLIRYGATWDVLREYLDSSNRMYSPIPNRGELKDNGEIRLCETRVIQDDIVTSTIDCRRPFRVELSYEILNHVPGSRFFLMLNNERGDVMFTTSDHDESVPHTLNRSIGRYRSSVTIPANLLKRGMVRGTLGVDVRNERIILAEENVFEVNVIESTSNLDDLSERHVRPGIVAPILKWEIARSDSLYSVRKQ